MGYPPLDEGLEEAAFRAELASLSIEPREIGPPHRRTVLLAGPRERPWSPGPMVLMSARLLRAMLGRARLLRPQRRRRRHERLDIRI